jgi:hypothetical protein
MWSSHKFSCTMPLKLYFLKTMAFNERIIKIWDTYLGKQGTKSSILLDSFFTFVSLILSMTKMPLEILFLRWRKRELKKLIIFLIPFPHIFSILWFSYLVWGKRIKLWNMVWNQLLIKILIFWNVNIINIVKKNSFIGFKLNTKLYFKMVWSFWDFSIFIHVNIWVINI